VDITGRYGIKQASMHNYPAYDVFVARARAVVVVVMLVARARAVVSVVILIA